MSVPYIGFSNFFLENSRCERGNSYTTLPNLSLLHVVQENWHNAVPGTGETGLDRKVLVPIPLPLPQPLHDRPFFFCPPRVKLVTGMALFAEALVRQQGEAPHVEVYTTPEIAELYGYVEQPAFSAKVVLYSAAALLENDGKRTGQAEWEIVTLLCEPHAEHVMEPLTMARNQLEMAGGTKPEQPYPSEEWAKATWNHANRGIRVRPHRSK